MIKTHPYFIKSNKKFTFRKHYKDVLKIDVIFGKQEFFYHRNLIECEIRDIQDLNLICFI